MPHIHRKLSQLVLAIGAMVSAARRVPRTGLAVVATLGLLAPAHAQVETVGTFGDWQLECDIPPGAQSEQCWLIQTVQAADRENIGLVVIVGKTADQQAQLIRVIAPLGVLLPFNLGLTIDGDPVGRIEFTRCLVEGCTAETLIELELLERLRTGTTATFVVFVTFEEGIGIPVSLLGFGDGFDALP